MWFFIATSTVLSKPILLKIRQKAHEAYTDHSLPSESKVATPPSDSPQDNLDPMLSGQTRLISKRKKSLKTDDTVVADVDEQKHEPDPSWGPGSMGDIHPTLVDHMREFYATDQGYDYSGRTPSSLLPTMTRSSSSTTDGLPYARSPTFSEPVTSWIPAASMGNNSNMSHEAHTLRIGSAQAPKVLYGYGEASDASVNYSPTQWNASPAIGQRQTGFPPNTGYQPPSIDATINNSYYHSPTREPTQPNVYVPTSVEFAPLVQTQVTTFTSEYQRQSQNLTSWAPVGPNGSMHHHGGSGLPYPVHVDPVGGLMHTGGGELKPIRQFSLLRIVNLVGSLEQTWRSFLSGVEFPTSPIPGPQHP